MAQAKKQRLTADFAIESPKPDAIYADIVPIKGWVMSNRKPAFVRVLIDGKVRGTVEINPESGVSQGPDVTQPITRFGFAGPVYSGFLKNGPHRMRLKIQFKNTGEADLTSLRIYKRPRVNLLTATERRIVDDFHALYYGPAWPLVGETWNNTFWLGANVWKCPLDLWTYQEIIYETQPDVIIESGTGPGGTALFLAHICDLVGHGKIITVDIKARRNRPHHRRIEYLHGSSTSDKIEKQIRKRMRNRKKALVILDSDHHKEHVLRELAMYSEFVSPGGYIIVEDTNLNGHPVAPHHGPGPMEAVLDFLRQNKEWRIDANREKFLMTFNPRGYLRRYDGKDLVEFDSQSEEEPIRLEDKSGNSDPLSILLEIYRARPDLKSAYPEVHNGDYKGLVEWANYVITNRLDAYENLEPYANWYSKNTILTGTRGKVWGNQ